MDTITYVGLDTHKATISVALAEGGRDGAVRYFGKIANEPVAVARLVRKLGKTHKQMRFSYEAGPCGYGLQRQLKALGHECVVAAPSMIPRSPGDRVQTDRIDATTLARADRAGELTTIWVPDAAHEAMRDLVRGRETAVVSLGRARQQLLGFLLRQGRAFPGKTHWSKGHRRWLADQVFEHTAHQVLYQEMIEAITDAEARRDRLGGQIGNLMAQWERAPVAAALTALRGVAELSAATLVAEIGDFRRFASPRQLMGYLGQVPSEASSGKRVRRGGITRAGNARVRRILTETSWHYFDKPRVSATLAQRTETLPKEVRAIAWKAQLRLHKRFHGLLARGKPKQVAVTAVARELIGFLWAIGCYAEQHVGGAPTAPPQNAA